MKLLALCLVALSMLAQVGVYPQPATIGTRLGISSLTVVATSSTQAIVSYTAPSGSACTLAVSESAGLTPLVNDVNTTKFASSNLDSRDGDITSGTSRIVVIGQRRADLALDSIYYSRALQANTTHYLRVTCGSYTATGSFATANVPGGATLADIPPANPASLGTWKLPTFVQDDRTQTQIDQFTGAYMKAMTIYSDRCCSSPQGFNTAFGGFVRPCTAGLQTSSVDGSGYVCNLYVEGPEATVLYFVRPSDGFVRMLGKLTPADGHVSLDPNMCFIGTGSGSAMRYCYNGDWTTQVTASITAGTAYSSVSTATQMAAFDATYNSALFPCGSVYAAAGEYAQFSCTRNGGGQDEYGWIGVFYGGDGRVYGSGSCTPVVTGGVCPGIVGAFNPMATQGVRFQSNHNFQTLKNVGTNPTVPVMAINWQDLDNNAAVGSAKWSTTLTSSITDVATTIVVDTCPTSEFGSGDAFNPGCWAIGDAIDVGPGGSGREWEQVTAVSGSGPYTLTITRTSSNKAAQTAGQNIRMIGNANNFSGHNSSWMLTYWLFASDPHGTALVRDQYFDPGGHYDDGLAGRLSEGYVTWAGDITTQLNTPAVLNITNSPQFHGLGAYCFGSICNMHPTMHQTTDTPAGIERNHFSDQMTFNGGDEQFGANCASHVCDNATLVTAGLYKYKGATLAPYAASYAANKTVLYRKIFATVAISGSLPYLDISSATTGDVITGAAGDHWKYCVAYFAGECRTASAAGDIYFNPGVTLDYLYCTGGDGPQPQRKDICIASFPAYGRASVPQFLITATDSTNATRRSRVLTGGVRGVREMVTYSFSKILPDASWYLMPTGYSCTPGDINYFCNIWLAKSLPFPAQDAYDRSDYVATRVTISSVPATTANVIVRFGYSEMIPTKLAGDFYCTSRIDPCVVNSATIAAAPNTDPFMYASEGTGKVESGLTGVSCASSCTVDLPTVSGRTVYYQIVYRTSGNATVSTGPLTAAIVP